MIVDLRAVLIEPGRMLLARIPSAASSCESVFISPTTAGRMALVSVMFLLGCLADAETTARIAARCDWRR